jgi:hypothetical protein
VPVDAALVIRMGSGLLLAMLGATFLALARRTRANVALGGVLLAWGMLFVSNNLLGAGTGPFPTPWIGAWDLAYVLSATPAAAVLLASWVREDRSRATWPLLAVAGGLALSVAYFAIGGAAADALPGELAALGVPGPLAVFIDAVYGTVDPVMAIALYASVRLAIAPRGDARVRHHVPLALGFGAFGVYTAFLGLPFPAPRAFDVLAVMSAAYLAGVLAAAWLVAAVRHRSRASAVVANAFLLVAVAGLVVPVVLHESLDDTGRDPVRGVVRTLEFAVLAWALLRDEEYGLRLRPKMARRGTLAATALASLFIVAQVAQNFLAAQYGLLMGGVVAGAFLFAANPLQRAIEGRNVAAHAPAADDRAEAVYRDALRIALKDRVVTREEELHLAELGERLGLPARRALELRHEVEAETQP